MRAFYALAVDISYTVTVHNLSTVTITCPPHLRACLYLRLHHHCSQPKHNHNHIPPTFNVSLFTITVHNLSTVTITCTPHQLSIFMSVNISYTITVHNLNTVTISTPPPPTVNISLSTITVQKPEFSHIHPSLPVSWRRPGIPPSPPSP